MKTLFLIRSGEAKERDNPGRSSRPLSKRGAKAVRACALAAASLGFSPVTIRHDSRLSTSETALAYAHASGLPQDMIMQDIRLELKETQERLVDYVRSLDDGLDSLCVLTRRLPPLARPCAEASSRTPSTILKKRIRRWLKS
jgi:phosphohistidine phosphatase SixA